MFSTLCRVNADVSAVPKVIKINPEGEQYSEQIARIVLLFGLTELKAQLCWDQDVRVFWSLVHDALTLCHILYRE
jgi:hypothetical protein